MNRNVVKFLGGLVLFVVVGGLIGWWLTRSDSVTPPPTPPVVHEQPPTATNNAVTTQPTEPVKPEEVPVEAAVPTPTEPPATVANWEDRLDELLGSDKIDEDTKADKIADMIMIPKLPEPAQKELAEHLVNLASDELYAKAANILKSEKTPASVGQVLLDDLFNRDQELMIPIMLEIALNEKHPLKAEAKENIDMVLQLDSDQTNMVQWSNEVHKAWKGEQP